MKSPIPFTYWYPSDTLKGTVLFEQSSLDSKGKSLIIAWNNLAVFKTAAVSSAPGPLVIWKFKKWKDV